MTWLDDSLEWLGELLPYLVAAVVVVVVLSAIGGPGHDRDEPERRRPKDESEP